VSALDPLQETLAHEHAAVFIHATLAARTSQTDSPELYELLLAAYRTHRAHRDQLTAMVTDLGGVPVAARPAYEVARADGPDLTRTAAADLERTSAEVYAALVGRTSGSERTWAIGALTWAAGQLLQFGAAAEAWPGAPELPR
jgi:hypothetical protein